MMVTFESITRDHLMWLKHNTGWLGRAAEDQATIGRALRGDRAAIETCVAAWNARHGQMP